MTDKSFMEKYGNVTVNVGIKAIQKHMIETETGYKSVNKFVQEAVDEKIKGFVKDERN